MAPPLAPLPTPPPAPPPDAARALFGDRLPLAVDYAQLLATDGVVRGLIGPREIPRLWSRHLLNCAFVADLLPPDARVVDIGSGAGLPGIPLALRRPDLSVVLVEPLLRRATFLDEAVDRLGLARSVTVLRARAEDARAALGPVEWMTARAVAPLDRLVTWCGPLLAPGGRLLALKGARAEAEVAEARRTLQRSRLDVTEIRAIGTGEDGVRVVVLTRRAQAAGKVRSE